MIIDGSALADKILERTKMRAAALSRPPRVVALTANETPSTRSYLAIKTKSAPLAGCIFDIRDIKNAMRPSDIFDILYDADAALVQLPLPTSADINAICDAIPIEKDADVLSSTARAAFQSAMPGALLPPVVGAIKEILDANSVTVKGKKAVVIGAGFLVGAPAVTWLRQQGAVVHVITQHFYNLPKSDFGMIDLQGVDIVISGAGSPYLIKPDILKKGVVLIDAGTSELEGILAGDADPACAAKCSIFTPVPGGVGPVAVAMLFANAVTCAERTTN